MLVAAHRRPGAQQGDDACRTRRICCGRTRRCAPSSSSCSTCSRPRRPRARAARDAPGRPAAGPRPLHAHRDPRGVRHRHRGQGRRPGRPACIGPRTPSADLLAFTLDKTSGRLLADDALPRLRDQPRADPLGEPVGHPRRQRRPACATEHHERDGTSIMLFARLRADDRAFWFLGPATYRGHEGERPMAITWELHIRCLATCISRSPRRWRKGLGAIPARRRDAIRVTWPVRPTLERHRWWPGAGSNRRPSDFQGDAIRAGQTRRLRPAVRSGVRDLGCSERPGSSARVAARGHSRGPRRLGVPSLDGVHVALRGAVEECPSRFLRSTRLAPVAAARRLAGVTQVVERDLEAHLLPGADERLVDRVASHLLQSRSTKKTSAGELARVRSRRGTMCGGIVTVRLPASLFGSFSNLLVLQQFDVVAAHGNASVLEVHVACPERAELAPAEAAPRGEGDRSPEARCGGLISWATWAGVAMCVRRPLSAGPWDLARVPDDRAVLDGHVEDRADEPVRLADRRAPPIPAPPWRARHGPSAEYGGIGLSRRSSRWSRMLRRHVSAHRSPTRGFSSR